MKVDIDSSFLTMMKSRTSTVGHLFKVTRESGDVDGFTDHRKDVAYGGVTYDSANAFMCSSMVLALGFNVGNMEITVINPEELFETGDLLARVWKNAKFELMRFDYTDETPAPRTWLEGVFGEIKIDISKVTIELRGLTQYFQNVAGNVTSKNCRYRLGDENCAISLGSPAGVTLTITALGSDDQREFYASAATQVADFFGDGEVHFTTGANAGRGFKVKNFLNPGSPTPVGFFELALPTYTPLQIGDRFTAIAGCRGRFEEDCVAKWNNARRFGGEPHTPTADDATKGVAISV